MKREMNELNLRGAFAPEPDFCHAALMEAARSVKEEKQVKKASFRAMLMAALLIAAMTAAAFAAGTLLGWTDFLDDYASVKIPQAAVEEMQAAEGGSWEVGPLTFTLTELLTDGHIAVSTMHITTTDGSNALLTGYPWDPIGANGENGRALAAQLGVDPSLTWIEAAQQLELPLYEVRGCLEVTPELSDERLEDPLYETANTLMYFSMPLLNPDAVEDALQAGLLLYAASIDLATGDRSEVWEDRSQTVTVPVCSVLEEKTYYPVGEAEVMGHTLKYVTAKRYITGAYLTMTYALNDAAVSDDVYGLYDVALTDGSGAVLPDGMSLSGSIRPYVQVEQMLGVDELPERFMMGGVTLQAEE